MFRCIENSKCNTDGASSGISSCGGIFRDHEAICIGCFSKPLGVSNSYQAELQGALRAIEIAKERNWLNLWLETHSSLVVQDFK